MLSLGRLVPYKRVDLAIGAAEHLGIPLVVAGDGPERAHLQALAGPNTRFVGPVSEDEAGRLLSSCRIFVFCGEEDFGIAPVEANAHGVPVVAYGRGGVLETMAPGVTAEYFHEQSTDAVMQAIQRALSRQWDEEALRENARRFNPARFREAFVRCVRTALDTRRVKRGA
jgi:glycosyltransferase involved in cell wall biosynthesis